MKFASLPPSFRPRWIWFLQKFDLYKIFIWKESDIRKDKQYTLVLYEEVASVKNCNYSDKIALIGKTVVLVSNLENFPNSCLYLVSNWKDHSCIFLVFVSAQICAHVHEREKENVCLCMHVQVKIKLELHHTALIKSKGTNHDRLFTDLFYNVSSTA